jgi:hypothetical protein
MGNIARPWMLAYTIAFGLLSAHFVYNNVENRYHTIFIIWTAIYYVMIFAGNLIYSLDYITPKIRKIWKFIFPIVILEFIFSLIIDTMYAKNAQNASVEVKSIAPILSFAIFFPTFWAHYKIGYGKEVDDDAT